MEEIIQQIIERITEHLTDNDAPDEIIDKVLERVNDSISTYMQNSDDSIQDGFQNIIHLVNEDTSLFSDFAYYTKGYLIDPEIDFEDLFQDTTDNVGELDSSFFETDNPGQSDPSFGSRLTTVAEQSHHDPELDQRIISEGWPGTEVPVPGETESSHVLHFTGNEAEDNEYWAKRAEHAQEEANFHTNEAKKAAERGDFSSAKDHERTASTWQSDANRFKNNIKK